MDYHIPTPNDDFQEQHPVRHLPGGLIARGFCFDDFSLHSVELFNRIIDTAVFGRASRLHQVISIGAQEVAREEVSWG
jgi:hypothetical protein